MKNHTVIFPDDVRLIFDNNTSTDSKDNSDSEVLYVRSIDCSGDYLQAATAEVLYFRHFDGSNLG